jgi:citrate lyase subunit beta / citryl-CoA lyase
MTQLTAMRSAAGAPLDDPAAVSRALACGADVLMVDLELPAGRRRRGRDAAGGLLASAPRPPVLVRVGPAGRDGDLTGDLAATVRPGLAGVIVPDCESPQDVRAVADKLDALEQRSGLSPGGISIIPLPETALGIRRYYDILAASPRVRAAWFAGTPGGDLARDVGYSVGAGGTEYLYLRSKVVCDARAAGIGIVIDCAWRALSDDEGFSADTQRSRDLGYTGRLTFNAAQAAIANAIYGHKESA